MAPRRTPPGILARGSWPGSTRSFGSRRRRSSAGRSWKRLEDAFWLGFEPRRAENPYRRPKLAGQPRAKTLCGNQRRPSPIGEAGSNIGSKSSATKRRRTKLHHMTDECCAEGVGRMLRSRAKPSERLRRLRKKLLDGSLNNLLSRTGGPSQAVLEILRRNLNDARPIQRRAGENDSPGHAHLRGDRGVSRPRLLLD